MLILLFLLEKLSFRQHDFRLNYSRKIEFCFERNVDLGAFDVSMVTENVMVGKEILVLLKTCRPGWNEVEVMFEILQD